MIRALLDRQRVIAGEHCLMVGDTTEDAVAAASTGIRFIWMTHGYGGVAQPSFPSHR